MEERRPPNPYYVDFSEYGGVVFNRLTRVLPELVSVARDKSEDEIALEQHFREVREILSNATRLGFSVGKTNVLQEPN